MREAFQVEDRKTKVHTQRRFPQHWNAKKNMCTVLFLIGRAGVLCAKEAERQSWVLMGTAKAIDTELVFIL